MTQFLFPPSDISNAIQLEVFFFFTPIHLEVLELLTGHILLAHSFENIFIWF